MLRSRQASHNSSITLACFCLAAACLIFLALLEIITNSSCIPAAVSSSVPRRSCRCFALSFSRLCRCRASSVYSSSFFFGAGGNTARAASEMVLTIILQESSGASSFMQDLHLSYHPSASIFSSTASTNGVRRRLDK